MSSGTCVQDFMTRPLHTRRRNDRLSVADHVMEMQRIRHLPVVDEADRAVGVVSQRDLFRSALARVLGYGEHGQGKLLGLISVKEVMTNDPITIGPDAPIGEAARLMLEHKIGCLLVVDGDRLVGILTESDFVRRFTESD
jgi:CBS domain-containing protein